MFQCSRCDKWEQEILNVEVDSEAAINQTEKRFARMQSEVERDRMAIEGTLWQDWYFGSIRLPEKQKKEKFLEDEFLEMRRDLIDAQWDAENRIIAAEEAEIRDMRMRWLLELRNLRVAPEHKHHHY
jgi:hypothetical protein